MIIVLCVFIKDSSILFSNCDLRFVAKWLWYLKANYNMLTYSANYSMLTYSGVCKKYGNFVHIE